MQLTGIHHLTAVTANPAANHAFYTFMGSLTAVFVAALREWNRSLESGAPREPSAVAGVKERVEKVMNVSIQRELEKIERGLGYLATVGSTAPFVGLFGTVWGIMNSFRQIALSGSTSIVAVAPGISEALVNTAAGLVAAE